MNGYTYLFADIANGLIDSKENPQSLRNSMFTGNPQNHQMTSNVEKEIN
jgi:hypothetical protein